MTDEGKEAPAGVEGVLTPLKNAAAGMASGNQATAPQPTPLNILSAIVNGTGIGLLLGLLLGLAVSPVVSGIIGTLSGLLAVLLGINENYLSAVKSLRIGAFGLSCVAGILLGMHIRTNNALLPSRQSMMEEYTAVGFTESEARDFIAYREFQLVPSGWKGVPEGSHTTDPKDEPSQPGESKGDGKDNTRVFADAGQTGTERKNVLYSSTVDGSHCYILKLAKASQPPSEIKNTFKKVGGTWEELATKLGDPLPEDVHINALLTLRDCFCEAEDQGELKVTTTTEARSLGDEDSIDHIRATLSASGPIWKTIAERLRGTIPEEHQKSLFLNLIEILGHD